MKLILWVHESNLEKLGNHFVRINFPVNMSMVEMITLSRNQIGDHWVQVIMTHRDYVTMLDREMIKVV